jgi:glucokinase
VATHKEKAVQVHLLADQYVVTFDVGGSHISAGLCRLSDLTLVRTAGGSLAGIDSFESFVDLIYKLGIEAAAGETNLAGASLAVPGPFDLEAGISQMQHKLEYLYGKNLRAALAERFHFAPDQIRFLNDAASYVLGEVGGGSLRGAARSTGLTLGTGVGCAFVVGTHHVTTGAGVPPGGEIWDFPYANGTVEDLISTRAIKAAYTQQTGSEKEVSAIAESATTDATARSVFENFGSNLGNVLRDVIAPFHPERVMIGGGIARSAHLFLPAAERKIAGLNFTLVTATLGDQAPLVGAAQFWREKAASKVTRA